MQTMADTTETGLPRAVTIAWGMDEAPTRGPNRGLSHERIIRAGIALADESGLSAVTMQAVAKSLGFTTMSLYRYVSSKEELLRLMLDAATTFPEKLTLAQQWQEALRQWADQVRDIYRRHPWALQMPRGQVSVLMPNNVRMADLGLAAMERLQLSVEEKMAVILVVSQHAAGCVELESTLADEGALGVSEEGAQLLNEAITPERFPHLAPAMQAGHYVLPGETPVPQNEGVDDEYTFGLDLIISGLEAREAER